MDKSTLAAAVNLLLKNTHRRGTYLAYEESVRQYNSLLDRAKSLYPTRPDIQSLEGHVTNRVFVVDFEAAASRLKSALEIGHVTSSGELLAQVNLPSDAPSDVALDFAELEGALRVDLEKTVLLLAGSIAEALLIARHTSTSARGPGLGELVREARAQKLLGEDTLKLLDALIHYRDLIHPRAETRNRTVRNPARVDAAISALKLLCQDLQDVTIRYR